MHVLSNRVGFQFIANQKGTWVTAEPEYYSLPGFKNCSMVQGAFGIEE
jgi:hypothetical protein